MVTKLDPELKPLMSKEEENGKKPNCENKRRMYVCCAIVYLGSFTTGMMLGLSSPLLPDIEQDKSKNTPHLTSMEASWVGSFLNIGGITGGIVAGYVMQTIGRKWTSTLSALPFVTGLIFINLATELWMLYVGRIISGLSVGTSLLLIPVYVGEISTPNLRGMLGSANQLCIAIGVLIIYELGTVLPWRWLVVAAMALPILLFFSSFYLVETPRYLMLRHHSEKAKETLQLLRGPNADIDREYMELKDSLNIESKSASWLEIIREKELRKPTLISIGVMYFQKFSGIPFVMFYSKPVLMTAGLKNGSSELNLALLAISGFQVIFTFFSSVIVDRTGRKILLVLSGIFMSISLTVLGVYFHLIGNVEIVQQPPDSAANATITVSPITEIPSLTYMPIVSLVSFISAYSIGFGPLAWVLMGEIIPLRARGNSAGFSTSFNLLLVFLVTLTFSSMMKTLTPEGTFWLFAGNNALSVVYIMIFLPETKGKSLEEIEAFFKTK